MREERWRSQNINIFPHVVMMLCYQMQSLWFSAFCICLGLSVKWVGCPFFLLKLEVFTVQVEKPARPYSELNSVFKSSCQNKKPLFATSILETVKLPVSLCLDWSLSGPGCWGVRRAVQDEGSGTSSWLDSIQTETSSERSIQSVFAGGQ